MREIRLIGGYATHFITTYITVRVTITLFGVTEVVLTTASSKQLSNGYASPSLLLIYLGCILSIRRSYDNLTASFDAAVQPYSTVSAFVHQAIIIIFGHLRSVDRLVVTIYSSQLQVYAEKMGRKRTVGYGSLDPLWPPCLPIHHEEYDAHCT